MRTVWKHLKTGQRRRPCQVPASLVGAMPSQVVTAGNPTPAAKIRGRNGCRIAVIRLIWRRTAATVAATGQVRAGVARSNPRRTVRRGSAVRPGTSIRTPDLAPPTIEIGDPRVVTSRGVRSAHRLVNRRAPSNRRSIGNANTALMQSSLTLVASNRTSSRGGIVQDRTGRPNEQSPTRNARTRNGGTNPVRPVMVAANRGDQTRRTQRPGATSRASGPSTAVNRVAKLRSVLAITSRLSCDGPYAPSPTKRLAPSQPATGERSQPMASL